MTSDRRIYLDHAATTPTDERVVAAMLPYLTSAWGNPSSIYMEAQEARRGLDAARRAVAEALGAKAERDRVHERGNGGRQSRHPRRHRRRPRAGHRRAGAAVPHIITSAIEHHAVLHCCEALEKEGAATVTYLPVDGEGLVDLEALRAALEEHGDGRRW